MKQNSIINAIGIACALALGTLAVPGLAQDNAGTTMDNPSYDTQQMSDQPSYLRRLDDRAWGNQPRTQRRDDQQPRGAQGPIRSDDSMQASGSRWDRTKSYFRQPVGNRGEAGFLNWRETNTDTP